MQCFQGQNLFHKDKKVISSIIWQPSILTPVWCVNQDTVFSPLSLNNLLLSTLRENEIQYRTVYWVPQTMVSH